MKLSKIIQFIESFAPEKLQEDYDNSGLLVGDPEMEITAAILCLDVTEEIIGEAKEAGANLIISHHPLIFHPIRRITGKSYTERIIIEAISGRIAIYCNHTSMDNAYYGVNYKICEKLGLSDIKILAPMQGVLKKLVTFVPASHAGEVRSALFEAGAGNIGGYDSCSFNMEGQGSYRAGEGTHPFAGEHGILHFEREVRIETVFPLHLRDRIVETLLKVHPYEEVAYDLLPVENTYELAGSGMIGLLEKPAVESAFLNMVRERFNCTVLRHSRLLDKTIRSVAVCGGSGSFLIKNAIAAGADVFLTSDIRYHQFFDADGRLVIIDMGHFESEQFTIELFYDILVKKISNFAIHFSRINTNPVYYYL